MATKAKAKVKKESKPRPLYVSKREMADTLRCSIDAISKWVKSGHFPPPWLVPGPTCQIRLWRADHFAAFQDTGSWPEEAKGGAGGQL